MGMFQVSQNNFMGMGLQATAMAQVGQYPRYRLALTDPYLFDKQISCGFDLFRIDQIYPEFEAVNTGLSLTFGFLPFKDDENVSMAFQYSFSGTDVTNLYRYIAYGGPVGLTPEYYVYDVDRSVYDAWQQGAIYVNSVSATLARNTIDDRFYPMRGSSNSIMLMGAGLTGADFYKGIIDSRWYFPFKWGTAFSTHGSAGFTQGYGGDDVPVFQRFFLGGLDSLRGMHDRSVGPQGSTGPISPPSYSMAPYGGSGYNGTGQDFLSGASCTGGDKMAFGQFEYLFPLIKAAKIRGVVFFDAGDAWGGPGYYNKFTLEKDCGIGIRWNSPFGPLRVDFGINLNKPKSGEGSSNFGFSAGAGF
jgi:outer membrane protein insertion porin family